MLKIIFLLLVHQSVTNFSFALFDSMTTIYKEMNCVGVENPENPGHIIAYNCPQYRADRCYFRSQEFKHREALKNCYSKNCVCSESPRNRSEAEFVCAISFPDNVEPDCIRQFSLDTCDFPTTVCGQDNIEKLGICWFEGKRYRNGQLMFSAQDECFNYRCVCANGFDNSTSVEQNKNCVRTYCGIVTSHLSDLRDRCAPVFNEYPCCPYKWKCPNRDQVFEIENVNNGTCSFGSTVLLVGEELETDDECLTCNCRIPPLVTCSQKPGCVSRRTD